MTLGPNDHSPKTERGDLAAAAALTIALSPAGTAVAASTAPKTIRVNVGTPSGQANAGAFYESVSGSGRFVAFESNATNLVPGDTNGVTDVFVRDRAYPHDHARERPVERPSVQRLGRLLGDLGQRPVRHVLRRRHERGEGRHERPSRRLRPRSRTRARRRSRASARRAGRATATATTRTSRPTDVGSCSRPRPRTS